MVKLSSAERVELGAILAFPLFTLYLAPKSGVSLELGELVAGAALLVLLQGSAATSGFCGRPAARSR